MLPVLELVEQHEGCSTRDQSDVDGGGAVEPRARFEVLQCSPIEHALMRYGTPMPVPANQMLLEPFFFA